MLWRCFPFLFLLTFVCLIDERTSGRTLDPTLSSDAHRVRLQQGWNILHPISKEDLLELRKEASDVFYRTYDNYIHHAFPKDDLQPMSCRGRDSLGGISITLLDCLDTLILMNQKEALKEAVRLVKDEVNFDKDHMINVFELNIRGLGGLTSAHALLLRNPDILPGYKNELLDAAKDLGGRLFKAFDHFHRFPAGSINLKTGLLHSSRGHHSFHDTSNCVACAGTLLLEMAMLGRLIDDPKYEEKTKVVMKAMYEMRSEVGLVGNALDTESETWTDSFSSTGANSDSYYEYLIKGYLLFGDEDYLTMFKDLYVPIMKLQKSELKDNHQWLIDANIENGYTFGYWVSSLSAFWPGLQVLAGQTEDAKNLNHNYTSVWMKHGSLPEQFSLDGERTHPAQSGYPLRPEHIESTFYVYTITGDPHYLEVGKVLQKTALASRTKCGHAQLRDVTSKEMEDRMESFFLAETVKYMYLLDSNITSFVNAFVFSTEAHIYPPQKSDNDFEPIPYEIHGQCNPLCNDRSQQQLEADVREMEIKFPLLRVTVEDFKVLRYRRCIACIHVTAKMEDKPLTKIRTEQEIVVKTDVQSVTTDNDQETKKTEEVSFVLQDLTTDKGDNITEEETGRNDTVQEKATVDGGVDVDNTVITEEAVVTNATVQEDEDVTEDADDTDAEDATRVRPKKAAVYDPVAIVRCLLELDTRTRSLRCAEVEDVATKDFLTETDVYSNGPSVFLVLRRPRKDVRRGIFVLSVDAEWIEVEGEFRQRNRLRSTNATIQSCPAEVLTSLHRSDDKSKELQLAKCRRSLVFGKVVAAETSEDCRTLINIEKMEDNIVVMDDYCGGRRNVQAVVQAGASAVIYIIHTDKRSSVELDFQVPAPVLFVSGTTGNRIMMALERKGIVHGMMGLTSAVSLTKCPSDTSFPKRSTKETCSDGRIDLLIPTDETKHALTVFFRKDMNYIVRKLHRNLRDDEAVIGKLLEQERWPKT